MSYTIALAGNPNCGKTTLFNELTGSRQRVGNWPGVTVDKKEGTCKKDKELHITDLPGTYSLSPYSAEEIIARDYLVKEKPDAVIDIVDGTSIERNLYLTLQILETGVPTVIALNMMDEVEARGDELKAEKLSRILGVPVVPITARSGKGIGELLAQAAETARGKKTPQKLPVFDEKLQRVIDEVEKELESSGESDSAWKAVKLLENDENIAAGISEELKNRIRKIIGKAYGSNEDPEAIIADQRYRYIAKVVKDTVKKSAAGHIETKSDKLDKIFTNRILALPVFACIMYLLFACTNSENFLFLGIPSPGIWLAGLVESVWGGLTGVIEGLLGNASPWVYSLVIDGIMAGLGSILGFIPLVLVLYLLISFLEDCGYMARIAFVLDRIFRRFGLSGKSFIPMLVATGCGVPGIMASRTIEQDRDRKMTIMTTGFIPCGAKMPIIALFAGALFGGSALVATSAYFIGVAAVVISGIMLKKFKAFAGEPAPFVMELPAYHAPSASNVLRSMWERGWSFIKRAGTIILLSTIILWFLSNFGFADGGFGWVEDSDASLLAAVGSVIAVIFIPLGFGNWQAAVATITGLIAKEEVVSTMQVFYPGDLIANIAMAFTAASAYSFMVFNLLCAPCFAAMGAIKREMNNAKWTWAAIGYMCGFAYVASLIVYQLGGLFTGAVTFGVWTVVALAALAVIIYLLVRKGYQGEDRSRQLSSVAAAAR